MTIKTIDEILNEEIREALRCRYRPGFDVSDDDVEEMKRRLVRKLLDGCGIQSNLGSPEFVSQDDLTSVRDEVRALREQVETGNRPLN